MNNSSLLQSTRIPFLPRR